MYIDVRTISIDVQVIDMLDVRYSIYLHEYMELLGGGAIEALPPQRLVL